MSFYQAQLGEEKGDVCLADSFIGKCLFRAGLSVWLLLLLGSHFSLLALYQSSVQFLSREKEIKRACKKIAETLFHITSYRASLRRLLL